MEVRGSKKMAINDSIEQFRSLTNTKAICILGMHRSGTSVITRVLNLIGVYFGDEDSFVPPAPDNPEGFWENAAIVDVHARIFQALGRGWDRWDLPLPMPYKWWNSPAVKAYRDELINLIVKQFSSHTLWGWKDPRTCICLPLWKEILTELKVKFSFVIVVRNPLEVAESLTRRNGFTVSKGWALWWLYTLNALYWTQGYKRVLICYEDFMKNWEKELHYVVTELSIPWPENEEYFVRKADEFIKPQLRHHMRNEKEALLLLPEPIAQLYQICLERKIDTALNIAKVNELFRIHHAISQLKLDEIIIKENEFQIREAERRAAQISELQSWVAKLEHDKTWLEEQRANWQRLAEERGQIINQQDEEINRIKNSFWVRLGMSFGFIKSLKNNLARLEEER
ncbi:MAG: sulfotransferase family protein [Fervidicoccus fontis]